MTHSYQSKSDMKCRKKTKSLTSTEIRKRTKEEPDKNSQSLNPKPEAGMWFGDRMSNTD